MKISGAVIQPRNIIVYSDDEFRAKYKGRRIEITTDHGFGIPNESHLKRYMIDVWDDRTDSHEVDTWEDCHFIEDAIRLALKGACLI